MWGVERVLCRGGWRGGGWPRGAYVGSVDITAGGSEHCGGWWDASTQCGVTKQQGAQVKLA